MSELKEYKCPNCGGRLVFDSQVQKLKCPFCDGAFDVDVFSEGNDYTVENANWNDDDLLMYSCNSCGGQIVADKNTAASSCPYCGNPVVMTGNVSGMYRPKKIIPFRYDKEQAKSAYRNFLKGKTLLPAAFKSEAAIDEIKGIYVPYWIFDGKAQAHIWFDATRTRHYSDSEYNYTETKYYKLFRSGSVRFADVPVDASKNISDLLTESIEPFDHSESKEFNENYLPGFYADKYDVDVSESREVANRRIANSTNSLFASTTSLYDTCIPSSSNIFIQNGKQEYVMYPVWLLNIRYKGKIYSFAMNGQTGKLVGELPSDNGKLASILAAVFVGTMAVASLLQFLFMR